MSATISADEVRRTAALASLDLTATELEQAGHALAALLDHFDVIAKVEMDGRTLGSPVERSATLADGRPDVPVDGARDELLPTVTVFSVAPDVEEGFFFVPKVK